MTDNNLQRFMDRAEVEGYAAQAEILVSMLDIPLIRTSQKIIICERLQTVCGESQALLIQSNCDCEGCSKLLNNVQHNLDMIGNLLQELRKLTT